MYEPIGLPGPTATLPWTIQFLSMNLSEKAPITPDTIVEKITRLDEPRDFAIPAPIPAPVKREAILPASMNILPPLVFSPKSFPNCLTMVPAIRVTNNPWDIPVNATMKYLFINHLTHFQVFWKQVSSCSFSLPSDSAYGVSVSLSDCA